MANDEVVETGVDNLIKLVESKKRISVPDAAKELKVDQKTVEQWVDFLVEEEKIGMDYKFTTPIIFVPEKKKSAEELSMSKEEFQKMGGKPSDEKSEIVSEDKIASKKADEKLNQLLNPSKAQAAQAKQESPVEHVKEMFMQIESLLQAKDVERAHHYYNEVKKFLASLPNTEENEFLNKKMIEINELFLSAIKTLSDELESESKQIDFLINQGEENLEQADVVSAKKVYAQLLQVYSHIPSVFVEQKKMLYNNIFEYYKTLITKEYSHSLDQIEKGEEQINGIIMQIESFLEQGNIDEANATFANINKIYGSLPHGFLEQKLNIHTKILKLYEELKIGNKVRELHRELLKLNANVAKTFEPRPKQFVGAEPVLQSAPVLPATKQPIDDAEMPFPGEEKNAKGELMPAPPPVKKADDSVEELKNMNITGGDANQNSSPTEMPVHPNGPQDISMDSPPDLMEQEATPNEDISVNPEPAKEDSSKFDEPEPMAKSMTEDQLFEKAMMYYNQKQYEESKSIFDQLYQENPTHARAKEMSNLIEGILKQDSSRGSKSKIIRAISSASIGNIDEARRELNEILAQDPNNVEAKKVLSTLDMK
jgi:tetratricopeptide (TPR) repeat protein